MQTNPQAKRQKHAQFLCNFRSVYADRPKHAPIPRSGFVLGTFEPLGPKEGLSILFRHTQRLVIKACRTTTFCGNIELSEQNE